MGHAGGTIGHARGTTHLLANNLRRGGEGRLRLAVVLNGRSWTGLVGLVAVLRCCTARGPSGLPPGSGDGPPHVPRLRPASGLLIRGYPLVAHLVRRVRRSRPEPVRALSQHGLRGPLDTPT
jgi:hypothetical protein